MFWFWATVEFPRSTLLYFAVRVKVKTKVQNELQNETPMWQSHSVWDCSVWKSQKFLKGSKHPNLTPTTTTRSHRKHFPIVLCIYFRALTSHTWPQDPNSILEFEFELKLQTGSGIQIRIAGILFKKNHSWYIITVYLIKKLYKIYYILLQHEFHADIVWIWCTQYLIIGNRSIFLL